MPGKRVRWKPEAERDLEEHVVYLGQEAGLQLALRFIRAAEQAIARLVELPELGAPRVFEIQKLERVRMWPIPDFPNHLIFYRPIATGVEIVRVLHAARDIPPVLEE